MTCATVNCSLLCPCPESLQRIFPADKQCEAGLKIDDYRAHPDDLGAVSYIVSYIVDWNRTTPEKPCRQNSIGGLRRIYPVINRCSSRFNLDRLGCMPCVKACSSHRIRCSVTGHLYRIGEGGSATFRTTRLYRNRRGGLVFRLVFRHET